MPKSPRRDPNPRIKRIVAAGLACLLLAPTAAWLLGVEAVAIENRKLAKWPRFETTELLEPEVISRLTRYLLDHLRLRDRIVRARAMWTLHVFGDSPSPDVHLGEAGWLFYDHSFSRACSGLDDPTSVAQRIARASRIIAESGRVVIVMIVPDKPAIYPERLGAARVHAKCATRKRGELRAALEAHRPRGYVDLWEALGTARDTPNAPLLYIPTDSHWTDLAAGIMTESILERAAPGLWNDADFVAAGKSLHVGDLTRMMGLRDPVAIARYKVVRKNLEVTRAPDSEGLLPGTRIFHVETRDVDQPSSPIRARRIFLLHDSFMYNAIPMLAPYFRTITFTHWQTASRPGALAREIARSQIVVFEVTERGTYNWIHRVLSDAALSQIKRTLSQR